MRIYTVVHTESGVLSSALPFASQAAAERYKGELEAMLSAGTEHGYDRDRHSIEIADAELHEDGKKWLVWTLDKAEIDHIGAKLYPERFPPKGEEWGEVYDAIAHKYEKGIHAALGDCPYDWENILEDAIIDVMSERAGDPE